MQTNTPVEDATPFEFLAALHKLSEDLSLAKSPEDQDTALHHNFSFTRIRPKVSEEETKRLWNGMRDADLIGKLLAVVARKNLDLDDESMISAHTSAVLYLYYIAFGSPFRTLFEEDLSVQTLIDVHTPRFCRNAISVHFTAYDSPKTARISYVALNLFGHWIHTRLSDKTFSKALDGKSILNFVYHIQFDLRSYFPGAPGGTEPAASDPGVTREYELMTTRQCATLMEIVSIAGEAPWLSCSQEAVQRYGARNVVERCRALFAEDAQFEYVYFARKLGLSFVSTLHIYYPIHRTFFQIDILATMLDQYWSVYSHAAALDLPPHAIHEDLTRGTLFRLQDTLIHIDRGAEINVHLVCDKLFESQNLMLILGKVLVCQMYPSAYNVENVDVVMKNLETFIIGCLRHRQNLRTDSLLIDQALHVHRCLRAMEFRFKEELPKYSETFLPKAYWEGVMQATFQWSHEQLYLEHPTNLVGCSYVSCPLFRDDVVAGKRMMLLCSRCRSAQYCNADCQRSDWLYSGHKDVCAV